MSSKIRFIYFNTIIFFWMFICENFKSRKSKVKINSNRNSKSKNQNLALKTGAENYTAYLPLLENKKIGIVTNPTGIVENKKHLVDFLLENKVDLQNLCS